MAPDKPNAKSQFEMSGRKLSAFDLARSLRIRSQMKLPSTDESAADLQHRLGSVTTFVAARLIRGRGLVIAGRQASQKWGLPVVPGIVTKLWRESGINLRKRHLGRHCFGNPLDG